MAEELKFEKAFVKTFQKKVGQAKTVLGILSPLTPQLATALKFHSVVYQQDNTPKQAVCEVELEVRKSAPFDLRLAVPGAPELTIHGCEEAKDWIAKRKGSLKKGKPSRLMIEFKVVFSSDPLFVFEWINKWGQASGDLLMTSNAPVQADLVEEKPKKVRKAAAGVQGELAQ